MSKFIDRLKSLSRMQSQPIGFRTGLPIFSRPRMQLVASLAQEDAGSLVDRATGADAGLLRIIKSGPDADILEKMSRSAPDIPWGGWVQVAQEEIKGLNQLSFDFIIFPAENTPLTALEENKAGKIIAVAASLNEGLLRAVNKLPLDAVLITGEQSEARSLTWHHLMLFRRFADLLNKPLLAVIPAEVTAAELQALWEAGINGVVIEVAAGQDKDRLQDLRQVIDKLEFPSLRSQKETGPLLPGISRGMGTSTGEEEDDEE
ncbi:MAG: hypothetical protein Q8Q07_00185 [Dehalococcoidales bacterium]|nr:hypothetical protein [Dehalococcoidales bacterium]